MQLDFRRARGRLLRVSTLAASAHKGTVKMGNLAFPCALGRNGCRAYKREGDSATPIGCWVLREVLHRRDRVRRPCTALPVRGIRMQDGWCDAATDRNYNRPVRHPYPASAERLWRQDELYDVLVVLGYNDLPRTRGRGSAIFMHVARTGYTPTEGCIALARAHLLRLLEHVGSRARIAVGSRPIKSARSFRFGR
jgi:L,D-peptidoglycan transpeptidase YkuD (ErfK/YbiS/YcfS/YnhG family)